MASLDEVLSSMPDMGGEEDGALDFLIDEDLRIITVPERGVVLGVEGDKDVNRVRFRMNRFYNGSDLSEFQIRINYQNADGDRNYFAVTEKTVDADSFRFIWTVAADAVAVKGAVLFVVNCFTADDSGIVQKAYHTTLGTASALEGLEVDVEGNTPQIVDFMGQLKNDLRIYVGTLVTDTEESAAAAATSAQNAKASAENAASGAAAARNSQNAASTSERAAKTSETNAGDSAAAAQNSAQSAATSAQNAMTSAENAASSASAAKSSETNAEASKTAAATNARAAATSKQNAMTSAENAASSASAAKSSETNAANSASAAKDSEVKAAQSAEEAKAVVATDKTLTVDGAPADAKTTGEALNNRYTKDEADSKFGTQYDLPPATKTTLGGVKVGKNLSIDENGELSSRTPTFEYGYTLPDSLPDGTIFILYDA